MVEISGERRSNRRYRIELPVRYRVIGKDQSIAEGVGTTRDISSGGIALSSETELPAGSVIELWVNWPAVTEDVSCVKLRVAGRVVRSSGVKAAIQIKRHDFMTCRKLGQGNNSSGSAD